MDSPWCYYKFTQPNLCNMDYINSFLLIVSGQKILTSKGKKGNVFISISQIEGISREKSFQFSVVRLEFLSLLKGLHFP